MSERRWLGRMYESVRHKVPLPDEIEMRVGSMSVGHLDGTPEEALAALKKEIAAEREWLSKPIAMMLPFAHSNGKETKETLTFDPKSLRLEASWNFGEESEGNYIYFYAKRKLLPAEREVILAEQAKDIEENEKRERAELDRLQKKFKGK